MAASNRGADSIAPPIRLRLGRSHVYARSPTPSRLPRPGGYTRSRRPPLKIPLTTLSVGAQHAAPALTHSTDAAR
jgi:hypothetical protein